MNAYLLLYNVLFRELYIHNIFCYLNYVTCSKTVKEKQDTIGSEAYSCTAAVVACTRYRCYVVDLYLELELELERESTSTGTLQHSLTWYR